MAADTVSVMSKLAGAVVVLVALVGTGAGVVLSRLTEVECPPLGTCFGVDRLSPEAVMRRVGV